jgi:hypothetical protein
MVTTYLRTYNNLQLLTNFIGGCEFPTKCTTIILVNDFNNNGNMSKSSIALLRFCAKAFVVVKYLIFLLNISQVFMCV